MQAPTQTQTNPQRKTLKPPTSLQIQRMIERRKLALHIAANSKPVVEIDCVRGVAK